MEPRPKIRLLLTIVRVYKLYSLTYLLQSLIIISPAAAAATAAAAAAAARVVVGLRCTTDDLSTVITFGPNAATGSFSWQQLSKTRRSSPFVVSDIAVFVLQRDVKLQLTRSLFAIRHREQHLFGRPRAAAFTPFTIRCSVGLVVQSQFYATRFGDLGAFWPVCHQNFPGLTNKKR